jgi:hypothetical protein
MLATIRRLHHEFFRAYCDVTTISAISAQRHIDELRQACIGERRLEGSGYKVYSQSDEDGIIAEIFRRIGATDRRFVEFGCGDGRENNTSYLLLGGWSGLWMDGSPANEIGVRRLWAKEISDRRLRFQRALITADNINDLVRDGGITGEIDLLVIDIDGNDYHVWREIEAVRPRVVCIEYNAKFPPPVEWIMPRDDKHVWDGSDWLGASLASLQRLGKEKGYELVGCNLSGVNAFFVSSDEVAGRFAEPFSAESHYHPPRYYLKFNAGWPPRT